MKKTIILLLGISLIGGLNWRSKFVSLEDAAGNHRRFRVSKNGFEPTVEAAPAILSIAPKSVSALSAEKPSSVVLGRSEIVRKVAPENSGANSAGTERYQLLRELRAWAATNTEAALAVVLKLPTGNDRDKELAAVCFGLAQSDPADAVKLAQAFHLDQQAGAVIENLTQQWAQSDVTSALTWAVNQPPGDARDSLITRVAFVLSQSDPADAASLVVNQIPPGSAQNEAVMMVLHQWAEQNLVAAAGWVAGFPDTPLREHALTELEGTESYQKALAHQ